ncbi:MAG TPA: tyrosine-type recombinase/integrase [Polyangia bacterium]
MAERRDQNAQSGELSLRTAVNIWLEHLRNDRGRSVSTVREYRRDHADFSRHLDRDDIHTPSAVRQEHVARYILSLKRRLSVRSRIRRFVAIRAFFRFSTAQGWIRSDPTGDLRPPASSVASQPRILSYQEVEAIIRAPNRAGRKGVRDAAVFALMYTTGMKVSEVIALTLNDVDFVKGVVRVARGARFERTVPVRDEALLTLRTYVTRARAELQAKALRGRAPYDPLGLFLTEAGDVPTPRSIARALEKAARAAGIRGPLGREVLRRSFAVHLFEAGAEMRVIQALLGQATLKSTQQYVGLHGTKRAAC